MEEMQVDSTIATFINHGCNGTSNFGDYVEFLCKHNKNCTILSETTTNPQQIVVHDYRSTFNVFSPVFSRQRFLDNFDIALQDIKAGDEILMNYAYYDIDKGEILESLELLKQQCEGQGEGHITEYTISKELKG